jgi:hypothetical protein
LNGGVSFLATIAAGALLLEWLPPWLAVLLIALLFLPYAFVLALFPTQINHLPLPSRLTSFLASAVGHVQKDASPPGTKKTGKRKGAALFDWLLLVPAIFAIVAGQPRNRAINRRARRSLRHSARHRRHDWDRRSYGNSERHRRHPSRGARPRSPNVSIATLPISFLEFVCRD